MIMTNGADQERLEVLEQLDDWLRVPMLVLSFVWLALVLLELVWGSSQLLEVFGVAIWIVFIFEFALRFALAPRKMPFLQANWLTVLALIAPALRLFRVFRVLRFARATRGLRLVRVVGTANRGMNALRASMRRRGFGYVLVLTFGIVLLGSGGMLAFEPAAEVSGGFEHYGEALWWTAMLMTTIGSEYWPQTAEGRILCLLLSIYALGVLGYITASIASFFIGRDAASTASDTPAGTKEVEALASELMALRTKILTRVTDKESGA